MPQPPLPSAITALQKPPPPRQPDAHRLSRRQMLALSGLALSGLAFAGCSGGSLVKRPEEGGDFSRMERLVVNPLRDLLTDERGVETGFLGYLSTSAGALAAFWGTQRMAEFIGSECYKWTFGPGSSHTAECYNEQAIIGDWSNVNCWANHKYRFCQNMSLDDFDAKTFFSTTVTVGGTVAITVTNNTPSYDTAVSISGGAGGRILPASSVEASSSYDAIVKHYDDGVQQHFRVRNITYAAPEELPSGQTEAIETLTFTAAGKTKTITLRIVQKCRDSRGREVPCR